MISFKSLQGKLLSMATFVLAISVIFIPNNVFAVSLYTSTVSTGTVGVNITPTLQYTYSPQQTWGDGDTLTFVLPDNMSAWSGATFAVEYDTDATNDGVGETPILEGGANGMYLISGRTLTIKWNASGWGAPNSGASSVRVVVTAGLTPNYVDAAAVFTFGGATALGVDTDPSGTAAIAISAADAAPSLALAGNSVVGATGNSTLTVTLPVSLAVGSKVIFTVPANLFITSAAYSSHTFGGTGTFSCAVASQTITCTSATATIPSGTGTIILTGISASYAASGQTLSSISVTDGTNNLAIASTGSVTNTTAAQMAASLTLSTNSVVGVAGDSTLTFTTPIIGAGSKVLFTAPSNLNVSGVTFVSQSFGGAATFTCVAVGQVVTCTSAGASISAGTGTIVMSGITATAAATGQSLTAAAVQDSSSNVKALSTSGNTVTDTTGGTTTTTTGTSFGLVSTPQNPTLVLNHGQQVTKSLTIDIEVSATGAIEVALSTKADFSGATWKSLLPVMQITLQNISGPQVVYAKFANAQGGESAVVSATVVYAPGTENASAPVTPSPVVTVPPPVSVPPLLSTSEKLGALVSGKYDSAVARELVPSIAHDFNLIAPSTTLKCPADSLVKIAGNSAVYYCGADGKRYVFPNGNIFKSWFADFSTVKTITADELAALPIGGAVRFHPGTTMIKLQTDPRVFAIAPGGVLRWVSSEVVAKKLYGDTWNKQVQDVSDAFISNYTIGAPITD